MRNPLFRFDIRGVDKELIEERFLLRGMSSNLSAFAEQLVNDSHLLEDDRKSQELTGMGGCLDGILCSKVKVLLPCT